MPIRQMVEIPTGGELPVENLCGWGFWKSETEFDYEATKDMQREQFSVFGVDPNTFELAEDAPVRDNPFRRLNIIGASPIKGGERMMLWELGRKLFGKDTPNYPQEVGDCFPPGTMVTMADGSTKPIEAIKVGEYVVTHTGKYEQVLNTIKKKYTGSLITIRAKGYHRTVSATADHRFVEYPYVKNRRRYLSPIWTAIGELEAGRRLLMPFGDVQANTLHIETLDDGREVQLDELFGRLLGIYLAEGGIDGNNGHYQRITLSLSSDEELLATECVELFANVFQAKATINRLPSKPSVILVRCSDAPVARFIKKHVPGNVYSKSVPPVVFRSFKMMRLAVLRGWLDGDGQASTRRITGTSASHDLIADMHRLALSCGLRPKLVLRKKASHQRVAAGDVTIYGRGIDQLYPPLTKARRKLRDICEHGVIVSVRDVSVKYVDNINVYCLEVDNDHSFIANGFAVHNCVSFGAKNAGEHVQFFPIGNGNSAEFKRLFPPYFYGTGRVLIGQGKLRSNQDGSLGVWQAKAVMQYGTIPIDAPGCPEYSGKLARKWGAPPGPPKEFLEVGANYLIKSAALVKSWADLVQALMNGYPVTIASNVGFDMTPRGDGFHHHSTQWGHQMCIVGVDNDYSSPYACILNSWGDVHGQIKDFTTGEIWPQGTLRVLRKDVEKILSEGDSFAYSQFDGFPTQDIPRDKFVIF